MATEFGTKAPKAKGNQWEGAEFVGIYDFGENLDGAKEKFGDEVVYSNYVANGKVKLQAIIRPLMIEGKSSEEIQAVLDGYKLGVARPREVDPYATSTRAYNSLSPEEQAEFIACLQRGEVYKPKKAVKEEEAEEAEE